MDEPLNLIPDLSSFPDCEERRRAEDLHQKLGILIADLHELDEPSLQTRWQEANKTWWEMNAMMGALIGKTMDLRRQRLRWIWSLTLSSVALLISLLSLALDLRGGA